MASATGVRPAAGLGDAGFFSFRSFHFFSLWVRSFSGLGGGGRRGGSCWNRAVEYSLIPAHPPRTRARPGLGVAVGFLHPQRILEIFDNPAKILQAGSKEPPWNPAGDSSRRARGRAQPGNLALARGCAQGRAPSAGRSPGRTPLATAPRPFPAAVVPSANLSLWMYQSRVPGGAGARAAEGPRPPMLLSARQSSPCAGCEEELLLQPNFSPHWKRSEFDFLVVFVRIPEMPFGMYRSDPHGFCARGEFSITKTLWAAPIPMCQS